VRSWFAAALLLLAWSCSEPAPPQPASSQPAAQPPAPAPVVPEAPPPAAAPRLQVRGTSFARGESAFEWRGITAFRLLEQIAHEREVEAIAYLDWARAQKLTVVRVLTMAKHLFQLNPGDGLKALPRLLALASERRLIVEVVALADTAALQPDLTQHVKAVATIAAAHPNAVVEIANEPWHPTQDPRLHDPAFVRALADLVPGQVPVALGSIEGGDGYAAAGRYATWHSPRSNDADNWGHVLALASGAELVTRWQKPIISDEPVGAAEGLIPGRRDNDPRRFAAAGAMTRLAGLGATFHYEGGLQARIPSGRELECFQAWAQGLDAMAGMPAGGRFLASDDLTSTAGVSGARAVFGRLDDKAVWVVLIDPGEATIEWRAPWTESSRVALPGVIVVRGLSRAGVASGFSRKAVAGVRPSA
jgi:hypothetical protein